MQLKIEETLNAMDMGVNSAIAMSGQLGTDKVCANYLDNIENLSNEEVRAFVDDRLNANHVHTIILTGWIFNEWIFNTMYSYYQYEIEKENGYYVIIFLEFPMMIVSDNIDDYKYVLSKLTQEQLKYSSLNLISVTPASNGVEIKYTTHTKVLGYDRRPRTMRKDHEIYGDE